MTNEKKSFFISDGILPDFLVSAIFFLTSLLVQSVIISFLPLIEMEYSWQMYGIVCVAVFLFIRRTRLSNILMIGAHIFTVVVYILVLKYALGFTDPLQLFGFALIAIANGIYSMSQRYKLPGTKKLKSYSELFFLSVAVHIVIGILFYIGAGTDTSVLSIILWSLIVISSFYALARQMNVLSDKYAHTIESQPVDDVRRYNTITVLTILGVIIVAVILLYIFPVESLSSAVAFLVKITGRFFVRIIKFLASLYRGDKRGDWKIVEPDEEEEEQEEPQYAPTPVIVVLFKIAIVLVIALIIFGLYKLFRYLMKRFNHEGRVQFMNGSNVVDIIEDVEKKEHFKFKLDFGRGEEYRIRKKYYGKVIKAIKHGKPITDSSSPNEIKGIMTDSDKEFEALSRQYEKVRYDKR